MAGETRGDHAGVVEHEHVARAQQVGQVADVALGQALGGGDEEAGAVARRRGAKRDPLIRQREVELAKTHS